MLNIHFVDHDEKGNHQSTDWESQIVGRENIDISIEYETFF